MIKWLQDTWLLFVDWIEKLWLDLTEFLTDLPIIILDGILSAVASLINAIPLPDSLTTGGLSGVVGALSPDVQYFLSVSGFASALAILGSGFAFRLTRKLITLFQW